MLNKILRNTLIFLLVGVLVFSCTGCGETKETVNTISDEEIIDNETSDKNNSYNSTSNDDSSSNKQEDKKPSSSKPSSTNSNKKPSSNSSTTDKKCDFHKYTSWKSNTRFCGPVFVFLFSDFFKYFLGFHCLTTLYPIPRIVMILKSLFSLNRSLSLPICTSTVWVSLSES